MKAKDRSVWQNKKTGKWIYEARVPLLGGGYTKRQRTAATEAEAWEKCNELYASLKSQSSSRLPMNFRELVTNYVEVQNGYVKDSTLANNKYLLDKYVIPVFGEKKPADITSIAILKFLNALRERGLATSTVNKIRSVFSVVFVKTSPYGMKIENPVESVRPLKKPDHEKTQVEEPWTIEEARDALSAVVGTQIDAFVHISVSLGLRKGEVFGLRWLDIDLDDGVIHVRENRGSRRTIKKEGTIGTRMVTGGLKTKASQRKLRLTNVVMLSLMRHKELLRSQGRIIQPDDFVVLGVRGKPMHEASLYKLYNRICAENGLRRIRIHDHRHTAAVIALSNKVDPIVTSYGLGHASFEITKRIYAQAVPMLSAEFSERIADALMPMELGGGGAISREGSNV
jgi:integrase